MLLFFAFDQCCIVVIVSGTKRVTLVLRVFLVAGFAQFTCRMIHVPQGGLGGAREGKCTRV